MWLFRGIIFVLLILLVTSTTKEAKREKAGVVLFRKENRLEGPALWVYLAFFLAMLCFWALTAFRAYSVGNDTRHYVEYFEIIAKNGPSGKLRIEMGFQYFCFFVSKFSKDPHIFLMVHATICYLAIIRYIAKYSQNVLFSVVLFFCFSFSDFTTALRQNLSMAIILYAYQALKEKKYIKFSLLVIFASFFHTSAIFMLALLLYKLHPKDIRSSVSIILLALVFSISGLATPLLSLLFSSYSSYFESQYAGSGWLGVFYYMLRSIVLYLIMYFIYVKDSDGAEKIFPFFVAIIITCFAFTMNQFMRGCDYLVIFSIVELPNALTEKKFKNANWFIILIGGISCLYFLFVLRFRPEWSRIIPYHFYMG